MSVSFNEDEYELFSSMNEDDADDDTGDNDD